MLVFRRLGILDPLLDVLDGDETFQTKAVVHDQKFFYAVLVQDFFRVLEFRPHGNTNQVLARHHVFDGQVGARLEAQVAVGQDPYQLPIRSNGHARDFVTAHDFQGVGDSRLRADGDRVHDHAAFRTLDLVNLLGLPLDRERAMNDANPALLRQRNRQTRFCHGVHGGARHGNVQRDLAGKLGAGVNFRRKNGGPGGQEKNVVKGERFRDGPVQHSLLGWFRRAKLKSDCNRAALDGQGFPGCPNFNREKGGSSL